MVNSCAAPGCTNRAMINDNRAFYKFPINNRELCKKLIVAIKRETFIPTEYSRICSDHFLPSDYNIPDFNNKPKLKPFAVSSIFIDSKPKLKESLILYRHKQIKRDSLKKFRKQAVTITSISSRI
nr:THAP domain-containing protein 1-like [Hydra vulgaris]